jgi:hypothetical protein
MKRFAGLLLRSIQEPVVQFFVLGLLLFAVAQIQRQHTDLVRIELTPQREARLARLYALQFGVQPDTRTLSKLVEQDIHEEILFRQGLALRLDQNDEIVRRRVIQKMQFLLEDLQPPTQPSEAQLQAYYRAHSERYTAPARVTFSHVFFSLHHGEAAARQRAQEALHALQPEASRAPETGDPFPDLYDFSGYQREQVVRLFGATAFSDAVFSAAPGHWAGPFRSAYGWHLLRVQWREPETLQPLAAVHDKVRADFLVQEQRRTNELAFTQLARKFTVESR